MPALSMRLLLTILVALSLTGCLSSQRRDNDLRTTLRKYEATIRWGHIENAYLFRRLEPDERPDIPQGLDNIRVTGYEVVRPPGAPKDDRITQTVQISYLFRDQQVVRTVVDRQTWEYDPDDSRWYLTSAVPEFR
ncbi:MAG: hypothetical protein PVF91_08270 [Chromatiales bacterium]|jgi:hypothetical protein